MPRRHLVIVGAQRCGTTYLYRLLDEHPQIEMAKPLRPEPKFFMNDELVRRGVDFYESKYFAEPAAHVRGEKSTSYLESDVAIRRIRTMLPDALLVVVLRDPVQRAVSNYRFSVQHRAEVLTIEEAMHAAVNTRHWDHSQFSVSPVDYLARGRYADHLERLGRHVDPEHLAVLIFEELVTRASVVEELFERLGVDQSFEPSTLGRVVNASEPGAPPLEPKLEAWLRDYFREPNAQLETLLGRQLPWPK